MLRARNLLFVKETSDTAKTAVLARGRNDLPSENGMPC